MPPKPPPIAFCNNGLDDGENGEPGRAPEIGLPFFDKGDSEYVSLFTGEPLSEVGVLAYLGGVT